MTVRNRIARIAGYSGLVLCTLGAFWGNSTVLVAGIWVSAFAFLIVSPTPLEVDSSEIGDESKISFADAILAKPVWNSMLSRNGIYIVFIGIGTPAALGWGVPWLGMLGIYTLAFLSFFKSAILEVEQSQAST
ncbi:hypothetical protein [uncultured Ruegeria sp.]|uniref:hypothetical protein n=1 Tax=uncultured Ruegeria sp. TaxID=259304 RepID=UPI0026157C00|nr:hypothetical protein [uncultured Ruegeria sp.]